MAGLDIDTTKLQLKLRAIAKHTEALAEELAKIDSIDKEVCPKCGSSDVEVFQAVADNKSVDAGIKCLNCSRVSKLND